MPDRPLSALSFMAFWCFLLLPNQSYRVLWVDILLSIDKLERNLQLNTMWLRLFLWERVQVSGSNTSHRQTRCYAAACIYLFIFSWLLWCQRVFQALKWTFLWRWKDLAGAAALAHGSFLQEKQWDSEVIKFTSSPPSSLFFKNSALFHLAICCSRNSSKWVLFGSKN